MTNEDFYALRQQLTTFLEERGFMWVRVDGTLGMPAPEGTGIAGWPTPIKQQRPDLFTLELSISASLAPERLSIPKPEPQHD